MTPEESMRSVIKSYLPLFVWLLLAIYSLSPSFARASGDERSAVESQLQAVRGLMDEGRWAEIARMKLPPAGSPIWAALPDAECELVYARGIGAARAGYRAMAWHAIERLEALRETAKAEALRRELD
jgi:hypothetical protein